jgi:hypothetical protein
MASVKELVDEELQDALDALHEAARRTGWNLLKSTGASQVR